MNTYATLPPALPYPTKSTGPKLSYTEALERFFLTKQGEVTQVKTATIFDFIVFIDAGLWASPKKIQARQICLEELEELDYTDPLSRFYAIDVVLSYGFPVALFASEEEATTYQKNICGK